MDIEIKKLKAINQVNLEIWQRISDKSKQYQTNAFANHIIQSKPRRRSTLEERYSPSNQMEKTQLNHQNFFFLQKITQVSFDGKNLQFTTGTQQIEKTDFSPYFRDINIFNDQLPSKNYFDLKGVIEKYNLLDSEKSKTILVKWKEALEKIQVDLGKIEERMKEELDLSEKIYSFFGVEKGVSFHFISKDPNTNLTFKLPCNQQNINNLKNLGLVFQSFFQQYKNQGDEYLIKHE